MFIVRFATVLVLGLIATMHIVKDPKVELAVTSAMRKRQMDAHVLNTCLFSE